MDQDAPLTDQEQREISEMFEHSFQKVLEKGNLGIMALAVAIRVLRKHVAEHKDHPEFMGNIIASVAELGEKDDGTDQSTRRIVFMAAGYYEIALLAMPAALKEKIENIMKQL